jgi:hypothetical protein
MLFLAVVCFSFAYHAEKKTHDGWIVRHEQIDLFEVIGSVTFK